MNVINWGIWKLFFLVLNESMKFDYIFWDVDGTMRPSVSEDFVFPEIKEIISLCEKDRQGIITNGHHERQLKFLRESGILDFVNIDLFFSPSVYAEDALNNDSHELRKLADSLDFETLRTYASKHGDYIFRCIREKVGDVSCVLIDDSLSSVLSAKRNGFTVVYLFRLESELEDIKKMGFDIDYFVNVNELKNLKEILID